MNKIFIITSAAVLCLFLTACSEEIKKDGSSSLIRAGITVYENGDTGNTAVFDDSVMLNEKLALYNTNAYHADIMVPHRYLIMGDKSVCLATIFEDTETAVEIKREAITSVESQTAGDKTVIRIIDNSGKIISFNTETGTAPEIIKRINN